MNTPAKKRKRFICAVRGHDWSELFPLHGNPYCRRCKRYDGDPSLVSDRARWFTFVTWCPLSVNLTRQALRIRVGWAWRPTNAYVSCDVHWGWDRTGELPGVGASFGLWRLRVNAGAGQGWQDEDGESRSLVYLQARFNTYGLRYVFCWLGHDYDGPSHGYISCRRCDHCVRVAEVEAEAVPQ